MRSPLVRKDSPGATQKPAHRNQPPNTGSGKLPGGGFAEFLAINRNMSLREKNFQSIAVDNELAIVTRNQMLSLEHTQMFGDSGPRGAD